MLLRWIHFYIIFVCLASLDVAAARSTEPAVSEAPECACVGQGGDRFERPLRLTIGRYRGECIDSCQFRATQALPSSGDRLIFANVLHAGRYWTANLARADLREIDFEMEEFLPRINHVFLRMRFAPGTVRLTPQSGGDSQVTISDLVFSAEGIPPHGHEFDLWESSLGRYVLALRVLSLPEMALRSLTRLQHSVAQYRLELDAEARERVLLEALRFSEVDSFQTRYHPLVNNCATSAVRVLLAPATASDLEFLQSGLPLNAPFGTLRVLESRALLLPGGRSRLPNLEEERAPAF